MEKEIAPKVMISVIMPVYNGELYLEEAIQSVVAQNHHDLEIILIDDGSTDGSASLISSFAKKINLKYFYQENQGPASARNLGITKASGEWITFLDADDVWPKFKIHSNLEFIKRNPNIEILWGMTKVFFETKELNYRFTGKDISEKPIFNTYLGAAFVKKSIFERIGAFNISLRYCEDLDWYQRVVEKEVKLLLLSCSPQ